MGTARSNGKSAAAFNRWSTCFKGMDVFGLLLIGVTETQFRLIVIGFQTAVNPLLLRAHLLLQLDVIAIRTIQINEKAPNNGSQTRTASFLITYIPQ